ncbi:hypothetical protein [Marinagarivorans cellulosilyticus]|uniref:Uncharacterized protein n=1 Tax=Marinagarivorans cellulosilyticus TaxID=2721545 RepID=A0AAN1WL53_9GAMM|nr:hypothetical protein [Marinagarivorans cellulosilyticus]BCD99590.1 hypothetical protein MARGE09_P3792 [Marinagarivorans cellulosilyticus]
MKGLSNLSAAARSPFNLPRSGLVQQTAPRRRPNLRSFCGFRCTQFTTKSSPAWALVSRALGSLKYMNLARGSKSLIVLAVLSVGLFVFMLYFRAEIYGELYIAPDEPYGISDIIEFLLGCVFIVLSAVSGIVALVLFFRGANQSKILASGLIVLHASMYLSFGPLHALVANCD